MPTSLDPNYLAASTTTTILLPFSVLLTPTSGSDARLSKVLAGNERRRSFGEKQNRRDKNANSAYREKGESTKAEETRAST